MLIIPLNIVLKIKIRRCSIKSHHTTLGYALSLSTEYTYQ